LLDLGAITGIDISLRRVRASRMRAVWTVAGPGSTGLDALSALGIERMRRPEAADHGAES
jgi:hypothetical protein